MTIDLSYIRSCLLLMAKRSKGLRRALVDAARTPKTNCSIDLSFRFAASVLTETVGSLPSALTIIRFPLLRVLSSAQFQRPRRCEEVYRISCGLRRDAPPSFRTQRPQNSGQPIQAYIGSYIGVKGLH